MQIEMKGGVEKKYVPFNQPLIAGSRLKYSDSTRTWSSFKSFSETIGFVFNVKVSPGTMSDFGR